MSLRIVDARWTPVVNMLLIQCDCGRTFEHRADRWNVRCTCGRRENIHWLRDRLRPRTRKEADDA